MSAEVVNAFEAEAHRLDAEADNQPETRSDMAEVQRELAQVMRNLALRSQGTDPAQRAAAGQAGSTQGLAVERTDEQGQPVPAPDLPSGFGDAAQAPPAPQPPQGQMQQPVPADQGSGQDFGANPSQP